MSDADILEAAERACDNCIEGYEIVAILAAVTPLVEANALDGDVLQDDLRDLLDVLGMPSGAQPRSPHAVFRDALTRIKLIRADALEEAAQVAEEYDVDTNEAWEALDRIAAAIRALAEQPAETSG